MAHRINGDAKDRQMTNAFYIKVRTWDQAVELAASLKRKKAAFYEDGDHYVVTWAAKAPRQMKGK